MEERAGGPRTGIRGFCRLRSDVVVLSISLQKIGTARSERSEAKPRDGERDALSDHVQGPNSLQEPRVGSDYVTRII